MADEMSALSKRVIFQHMCIDIDRLFEGFVKLRGNDELLAFFGDISQVTFVFKNAIYTFQTVLGDSVVIYRAYVVWQSVWPIVLPSILLCGVIATGIGSVFSASLATPNSSLSLFEQSGHWITAFFSSTLACNLIGTLTLAYRLWTLDRNLRHIRSRQISLFPIVLVCVDSGILYSAFLMSALILLVRGSRAQYIVLDMISPIISISFYAIILRVEIIKARRAREARRVSGLPPLNTRGHGHLHTTMITNSRLSFVPSSPLRSQTNTASGGQSISLSRSEQDNHAYPPSPIHLDVASKLMDNKSSTESPLDSQQMTWDGHAV